MNEEEKQAIDWLKEELDDEKKSFKNCNYSYKGVTGLYGNNEVEIALKLIEKQQKEIERRLKEIDSLYKMMSAKDDEIEKLKEDYQILKDDIKGHNIIYLDTPEFEEIYISKDKIREKIDLIDKEYAEIIEKNKNDLYLVNINAQRHSAMQSILEELLEE